MQFKANILYVDDDEDSRELLQFYFADQGYCITTAQNSAEAIKKAGENRFDLFMLDVRLPDGNGGDLALILRGMQPFAPIIYYTASGFAHEKREAMAKCGDAYLVKPVALEEVEMTIEKILMLNKIASLKFSGSI